MFKFFINVEFYIIIATNSKIEDYFNKVTISIDEHFNQRLTILNLLHMNIVEKIFKEARRKKYFDFKMKNILPKQEELGIIKLPSGLNRLENVDFNETKNYKFSILSEINDIIMIDSNEYIVSGLNKKSQHVILRMDRDFKISDAFNWLENESLDFNENKIKFATDFNEHLFISMKKLNEVFICELYQLNKIKARFGNKFEDSEKNIEEAIDISYYKGLLYILDSCKRIQVYKSDGDYERSIYLYVPNLKSEFYDIIEIKNPQKLEIFDNLINVLSNSENLYVFNLNGEFLQCIESKDNIMSSVEDRFLITLNINNTLKCYEKSKNNLDDNLTEIFSKQINFLTNKGSNEALIIRKYQNSNLLIITKDSEIILF